MDRLSHNAIELRYVDAIYELTNIIAIYNAHGEREKAQELKSITDKLADLRHKNYNGYLKVRVN